MNGLRAVLRVRNHSNEAVNRAVWNLLVQLGDGIGDRLGLAVA